jgi:hypothetical protein
MLTGSSRLRGRADNAQSDHFANLEVVFSDLRAESEQPRSNICSLKGWRRLASDAANDYIFLLNCEVINLWQRNTNACFSLIRKLIEAKSLARVHFRTAKAKFLN